MTVAVITDSAASLPPDLARDRGVTVVPLRLRFGGDEVRDSDISVEEAVRRADRTVQTSGPPPAEYAEAIDATGADAVLVLTISSHMSSTFDAARAGAAAASVPATVLDTGTAGGAQGLVVLAAAAEAAAGADLATVEAAAKEASAAVRLVAAVDSLDSLVRSGRVPGIAGWAGNRLGLRPLFSFRSGKVHRMTPATSPEQATSHILRTWRRARRDGYALHVAVLHAQNPAGAADLLEHVRREEEPASAFTGEFSPVMVVHTGPLLGLAWRYARL